MCSVYLRTAPGEYRKLRQREGYMEEQGVKLGFKDEKESSRQREE